VALIRCPACGTQLSDTARVCPHCRRPILSGDRRDLGRRGPGPASIAGLTLVALALVAWLASLADGGGPASSTRGGAGGGPQSYGFTRYARRTLPVRTGAGERFPVRMQVVRGELLLAASPDTGGWVALLGHSPGDTIGFVPAEELRVDPLPPVEVESWSWRKDASGGDRGALVWTAVVRNNTMRYVPVARLALTSYDASGHVLDTSSAYVRGLRPGGTLSVRSHAPYVGVVKKVRLEVVPAPP
jgi:hypothetical protein